MKTATAILEPVPLPAGANEAFVLFSLAGADYAIPAVAVQEVISLPALTPNEEAPGYIAGLLNLRGRILPVMDLWRRFGRPPRSLRLTDSVIVLDWQGVHLGIIVDEVHEVREIPADAIESCPDYGREVPLGRGFQAGVAKLDRGLAAILHLDHLFRLPEEPRALGPAREVALLAPGGTPSVSIIPTTQVQAVFQERADRLRTPLVQADAAGLLPLAIVALDEEYFGVELDLVREFAPLREVAPVPCCPPHVLGQINLRGDILTVVDLRRTLNLPPAAARPLEQVMIVHVEELLVGVAIKSVHDVVHLP
ncbi:MAG: chemotaxis protein CheW, partial [Verrucomicrobia bacterium]|nr:chemotaxis protein CheW [Verrucomicrobiota bacterium]